MSLNNEYKNIMELGRKAGISELMEVYGGYHEYIREAEEYLKGFEPKLVFSVANSTHLTRDG
ncbi:MAG: hypothetical protein ACTSRP_15715 [Candidatus Helarchaeota archaeon]